MCSASVPARAAGEEEGMLACGRYYHLTNDTGHIVAVLDEEQTTEQGRRQRQLFPSAPVL